MKFFVLSLAMLLSSASFAKHQVSGSDTLGGVMTDAIIAAGLDQSIAYTGGGSGVGEKAFVAGEIGITAMSRPMKPELVAQAQAAGVNPVEHVIALDGVSVFVHNTNGTPGLDLTTLARIFTCEITSWAQIPGSGKSTAIVAFRRDDLSGTTDTFKSLVGIKKFGDCVTVLHETADIAEKTATNPDAVGYAGLSGKNEKNREMAIAKSGNAYVAPTAATIRSETYPLSRKLFVYEASGARTPNEVEGQLLEVLTDRSFMDPIVQDHDFVTID